MTAKINRIMNIHEGRVFNLVRENVTLENGTTVDLDIIRHPGASAIVPVTQKGMVVLIKQYRHALGEFIWELPAGVIDKDEAPLDCAKRELAEETGFSANAWQKLCVITPAPGNTDERIHIFHATDLVPAKQHLEDDEMLHVYEMDIRDAVKMIYSGDIQDGKTIVGLLMATYKEQSHI
jgi:ADP-ribose pyrophosphatase